MNLKLVQKGIKPRGLLNEVESLQNFNLDLYEAPSELKEVVSNIWHVHWDLPNGVSYQQSNLPHPVQHIVLDPVRGSGLFGCSTNRFDYEITGVGNVIGLKLFPGMGRAFVNRDIASITDDCLALKSLIPHNADKLETDIKAGVSITSVISDFCYSIAAVSGNVSQAMKDAREAVELIESTKELYCVSDVSRHLGVGTRHLQRLFAAYVGVSPKWVIDRYRMLEALDILYAGEGISLSKLAHDLAYSDQSHFSNRFKAITGVSPLAYLKQSGLK